MPYALIFTILFVVLAIRSFFTPNTDEPDLSKKRAALLMVLAFISGGIYLYLKDSPKKEGGKEAGTQTQTKTQVDAKIEAKSDETADFKKRIAKLPIPPPEVNSFAVSQADFIAMATGWGWICQPPTPSESLVFRGGKPMVVRLELVHCHLNKKKFPELLPPRDYFRFEGTKDATYLIIYQWDLGVEKPTSGKVAIDHLTEIATRINAAEALLNIVTETGKKSELEKETKCNNFLDCPSFEEIFESEKLKIKSKLRLKDGWNVVFHPYLTSY